MELLERDDALAALVGAREEAARGNGSVALVTGEPGIGKTSLVNRFLGDLEPGARVPVGSCDDLTIPRPLGPVRDLIGFVSSPLERALADGSAAHELQRLLLEELDLAPRRGMNLAPDIRNMLAAQRRQDLIEAAARHRAATARGSGVLVADRRSTGVARRRRPSDRKERVGLVEPLPDAPSFPDLLPREAARG